MLGESHAAFGGQTGSLCGNRTLSWALGAGRPQPQGFVRGRVSGGKPQRGVKVLAGSPLRLLVQAGCDLDVRDHDGWTPLHAAAHWGVKEACSILAEALCNMDARNKLVSTPGLHKGHEPALGVSAPDTPRPGPRGAQPCSCGPLPVLPIRHTEGWLCEGGATNPASGPADAEAPEQTNRAERRLPLAGWALAMPKAQSVVRCGRFCFTSFLLLCF